MEKSKSVIVDESMGAFDFEDRTPCTPLSELALLEALDAHLRAQAAELPAREFWAVMGHSSVVHLVDKMNGLEGAEYLAAYREMVSAFKYVLTKVEKRGRKATRQ